MCIVYDSFFDNRKEVGMWATIAQEVGGDWLHFFMAFGGMLSSLGGVCCVMVL